LQRAVGLTAVALAIWIAVPQAAESAIRWQTLMPQSIETARQLGRPAVVDFVADWCIPCHEMDRTTFADAAVRAEAERFEMFKADITQETAEATELSGRYQVQGVPTVIFFDSGGTEVHRLVGYVGPAEMHDAMRRVR
jgi:thiol:disulfide interchange protein DsbD